MTPEPVFMPPVPRARFLRRLIGFRRRLSWKQAVTALKYPNYRLWFWGQIISLFGTWMESTALGFLVFDLTKSPAYLGFIGFANGIPTWMFMLYAGVIADRMSRRTLLMITQSVMMLLAFVLAALTFLHWVQPWHILVIAALLGTANAFEAPARQSFVLELVEPEDMTNAIALNATMFNSAMAIGPTAAGLIYAFLGPAWCFALNGASFLAVIINLQKMKLRPFVPAAEKTSAMADLKEGLKYVAHHRFVQTIIGLIGVVSLFGISFVTLFPAWAVNVLHGDAKTNGFLQSARGIGAVVAALLIASLGRFRFRGQAPDLRDFRPAGDGGPLRPRPRDAPRARLRPGDRILPHPDLQPFERARPDERPRRAARPGHGPLHADLFRVAAARRPGHGDDGPASGVAGGGPRRRGGDARGRRGPGPLYAVPAAAGVKGPLTDDGAVQLISTSL